MLTQPDLTDMKNHDTNSNRPLVRHFTWRSVLLLATVAAGSLAQAQNCNAVVPPYSENFDSAVNHALPGCMGTEVISGNAWGTWPAPAGMGGMAGAIGYTPAGSPAMNSWLFTRGLNLTAGTTYRLRFKYFNLTPAYTERMKVAFGTDTTAAAMANTLANYSAISSEIVLNADLLFTPTTSGVAYIGFQCYSIANQNYLYLDDILVELATGAGVHECAGTNGIAVYPNPASSELFFSTPGSQPMQAKVYDMVGHLVLEHGPTTRMDISGLAPGSYDLQLSDAQGHAEGHVRFVKY